MHGLHAIAARPLQAVVDQTLGETVAEIAVMPARGDAEVPVRRR